MVDVKILADLNHRMLRYKLIMQAGGRWNDIRFTENPKADYYLVLDRPQRSMPYVPHRTIVMQTEPEYIRSSYPLPFDDPYPRRKLFFYVHDIPHHFCVSAWHISADYSRLVNNEVDLRKSKLFSTVTSAKNISNAQRRRLKFINRLSREFDIDIYGRGLLGSAQSPDFLKKCRGELPGHAKDGGLFQYRYTFASENCSEVNYFTEKIIDPILSECLCFYWGCPNIGDFLDPRAYIVLDPNDIEKSCDVIRQAFQNDEWSKRLPYIREMKKKILNELHPWAILEKIIREGGGAIGERVPEGLIINTRARFLAFGLVNAVRNVLFPVWRWIAKDPRMKSLLFRFLGPLIPRSKREAHNPNL